MKLAEYKALCEEVGTTYNPDRLNEKPDKLVRLKVKLVKEFKDFPIKFKDPLFMSLAIMFENGNFVEIILNHDPEGRILLMGSFPSLIYLENDDKLIPVIREIVEELED